jgi:ankyrin repeat protein
MGTFTNRRLLKAAAKGELDKVARHLAHGADANARGKDGGTALHRAAWAGSKNVAELLLEHGAVLGAVDGEGATPLHLAASRGHDDVARLLVARGAMVYARDKNGQRPLDRAGEHRWVANTTAIIHLLETHGAPPLHQAANEGRIDRVEQLLLQGADVNTIDDTDDTPLHCAARHGDSSLVDFLMLKGADVNARNARRRTPLHEAVGTDITQRLITAGADVHARDNCGRTPLYHAPVGVADVLIASGAKVTGRGDNEGETPLHAAADEGKAEFLVARGAVLDATDREGNSPLHAAAGHGREDVVRFLVARGASIDATNKCGRTPLHQAAAENQAEVAQLLIGKGAKVDAADASGLTPLHVAAEKGHVEMADLLIARGADVGAESASGKTPLAVANAHGMALLLKRHGSAGGRRWLDGVLIIFRDDPDMGMLGFARDLATASKAGEFGGFAVAAKQAIRQSERIDAVLDAVTAHGSRVSRWKTRTTPVATLVDPDARNPIRILEHADVQFRKMGIPFQMDHVEHAGFEQSGACGVSGVVVTHWTVVADTGEGRESGLPAGVDDVADGPSVPIVRAQTVRRPRAPDPPAIKTLLLCGRGDNLDPDGTLREAVEQLRSEGTAGSAALASLICDQLESRTRAIIWSLSAAGECEPTQELVETVQAVRSADAVRPGGRRRFPPEIEGAGKIGWTDATHTRVGTCAAKALAALVARGAGTLPSD